MKKLLSRLFSPSEKESPTNAEVVQKFSVFFEREGAKYLVANEKNLPFPKSLIKDALVWCYLSNNDISIKGAAKGCYLSLSSFQKMSDYEWEKLKIFQDRNSIIKSMSTTEIAGHFSSDAAALHGDYLEKVEEEGRLLAKEFTDRIGALS